MGFGVSGLGFWEEVPEKVGFCSRLRSIIQAFTSGILQKGTRSRGAGWGTGSA